VLEETSQRSRIFISSYILISRNNIPSLTHRARIEGVLMISPEVARREYVSKLGQDEGTEGLVVSRSRGLGVRWLSFDSEPKVYGGKLRRTAKATVRDPRVLRHVLQYPHCNQHHHSYNCSHI